MEKVFSPDLTGDWKVVVAPDDLGWLIGCVDRCYQICVVAKGSLNEHQFEAKLMRVRDDQDKTLAVIKQQERVRVEYELARARLALAIERVNCRSAKDAAEPPPRVTVPEMEGLSTPSFDGLDDLIAAWQCIVEVSNLRAKNHNGAILSERVIAAAEIDVTDGLGKVALKKAYDAVCKGEKSIFEFDLEEQVNFRFYPVDLVDELWEHWVDSLRAAILRVFNLHCGCEERLKKAKGRLNEAQFRQRLQDAIVAKNEELVKKLCDDQHMLRADYAAAILQGLATWRFIDRILSHLKTKLDECIQIIEAQKEAIPSTGTIARMANCISAYSWIQSVEQGRHKCIDFSKVAREEFSQTAFRGFTAVYETYFAG